MMLTIINQQEHCTLRSALEELFTPSVFYL